MVDSLQFASAFPTITAYYLGIFASYEPICAQFKRCQTMCMILHNVQSNENQNQQVYESPAKIFFCFDRLPFQSQSVNFFPSASEMNRK